MVVVGNKCDLSDERVVDQMEGQRIANTWSCPFYETSAKEKINNEKVFYELVREIRRYDAIRKRPVVEPTVKPKWKCCII
mmetsp:Transcript_1044/g.1484  ORF Transcript_1044/g.1484 Transcript_1044/m.1484 type:complete len:80 (-) Transcript_1044:57-296(-)